MDNNMSTITPKARVANDTDKAKAQLAPELGYTLAKLEALSIAWVPAPQTLEMKALIRAVAEARSTTEKPVSTRKVLHDMMMDALAKATPAMEKEAAAILAKKAEGETEEALEKEAAAMARKMAQIQEMLALKKAQAAKAAKK